MKSKAIFMALLALTFGAQGAPVSDATARLAAGSWAVSDASLGVPHGNSVGEARAYGVDGTNGFYAVSLEGGGTLFLAADDEMDPVLAFTAAADVDLSAKSPLRNLLNRDIAARRRKLAAESQAAPTRRVSFAAKPAAASAAGTSESRAKKLWASLTEYSNESSSQSGSGRVRLAAAADPRKSIAVSDMRVAPFLTSKWSQERDKFGNLCYNYYTPNNYPCGCVATAAGQILYYWKCPQGSLPKFSQDCTVDKNPATLESHGDSRLYDWDAMVGVPGPATSDAGRQAIGALLYDLGVAFKADYAEDATGALERDVPGPLHEHFGFASAYTYSVNGTGTRMSSLHTAPTRQRVIFANLDAKRPVELYILSEAAGGHAVVADGYGYVNISGEEVEFTHINMGWAGTDDMWYNLPVIQTEEAGSQAGQSGGYTFEYLMGATFNIHPTETGDLLTGRITDDNGLPVENASVAVYSHGSLVAPVAVTNSDVHGIYSFTLPGDAEYDIVAVAPDGRRQDMLEGVLLKATTVSDTTTYTTASAGDIGNSWGNDIVLHDPRVRIVTGVDTNEYATLDKAIAGARAIAASSGGIPELEILRDVDLKSDATIDFDCVIRAASGDESSTQVNRPSGATITVASGSALLASNCVFEATGRVPLVAAAGGRVYVGPGFAAERVAAGDAAGFNVVGFVTSDIAVECLSATIVGSAFGKATTDDPAALASSVARLYAVFDENREVRGSLVPDTSGGYTLVWAGGVPVPVDASAGYYVAADSSTKTFASLDSLFAAFENARLAGLLPATPEIVIVGRDENGFSGNLVVSYPLSIRGVSGAFIEPGAESHIVVTNGGSLVVRDVAIGDRSSTVGDTFIRILGGGSMTLGAGAVVTNIVCTGNPGKKEEGPVAVMSGGLLRMEPGAGIVGCSAKGNNDGGKNGGGVYVAGGGTLDLAGGSISGCQSVNGYGGGVYAKKGANVVVSGPSVVSGNLCRNNKTEDIYFADASDKISITASAAGGSIGIKYSGETGNAPGFVFAEASGAAYAAASRNAFFNDANAARAPKVVGDTKLAWSDPASSGSSGPTPVDPSDPSAVARVDYPGVSAAYASVEDAFAALAGVTGAATLTLLQDGWITTNLAVTCNLALQSAPGGAFRLQRIADASVIVEEGASLAVANVVVGDYSLIPAQQPLFDVRGGALELQSGAEIRDVVAYGRFGAAVTVTYGDTDGGTFTMRDGSLIADCLNIYDYVFDSTAYAGGLLLNGKEAADGKRIPRAYLYGGAITNCVARRSGGVFAGIGSEVYVSGTIDVVGNLSSTGGVANLTAAAGAALVLADVFTGQIGVGRDVAADRVVFGRVGGAFSGSNADLVASAMRFTGDCGQGYGLVSSSSGGTKRLVWSERMPEDGVYVDDDGNSCPIVSDPSVPFPVPIPTAAAGLVYNGEVQTGVVARTGYTLSGTCAAVNAGDYSATASLAAGYVWSDGTTAARSVPWAIAKATYDMSGVVFKDKTFAYDGTPKALYISGMLPGGVEVSYDGNDWSQPGAYVVTASFTGDAANYGPIPDMTATLTIVASVARPTALTDLVYNAAAQSGVAAGDGYSLSGDVSGVNAGTNYTVVASLDDHSTWSDGTTNDLVIVWSINPAPLAIVASNAWKYAGAADPLPFAYRVEGLQGADTAAEVLAGALDREPGESRGKYAINQGDLRIADGMKNYFIDKFTLGWFSISIIVLPPLPSGATAVDVSNALDVAVQNGLRDGDVVASINGAADPVAAYDDFKKWANTIEGGEDAVAASDHAWASYEFGVTELFQNEPAVTFTSMSIEDPATASMNVKLVVKDGDVEKDVDPASVAKLFEVSANLKTWTDEVTVTSNPDGSYTVKPDDPTLKAAFIRLKY